MKIITIITIIFLLISCIEMPEKVKQDGIADNIVQSIDLAPLELWQERVFSASTDYSLINDANQMMIKAQSESSASMLLQRKMIDLNKTPFLNWEWKIDSTLAIENETQRAGDDYAARLYIAVANRGFSLYPRALIYVWANHSPRLTHWFNPYSEKVVMFAIQTGNKNSQQWMVEKRDLRQDLAQLFSEKIDEVLGIAIMTDTDNSQSTATAYYRNIYFSEK